MTSDSPSAGDPLPGGCELIEVRVAGLRQLFNAMDPSPFHEKDLDPDAEEFIVSWSRELPADAPLGLVVHLERPPGPPDEAALLGDAVHEFFARRSQASRRRLRQLFRVGRTSLVIGLFFLTALIATGDLIVGYATDNQLAGIVRESLLIGGWVAMWRPLEIFLYDWWPIRTERRLLDRLSVMPVRIVYDKATPPDAWRADWPAVPPHRESAAMRQS